MDHLLGFGTFSLGRAQRHYYFINGVLLLLPGLRVWAYRRICIRTAETISLYLTLLVSGELNGTHRTVSFFYFLPWECGLGTAGTIPIDCLGRQDRYRDAAPKHRTELSGTSILSMVIKLCPSSTTIASRLESLSLSTNLYWDRWDYSG